jgi:hypothetical protein
VLLPLQLFDPMASQPPRSPECRLIAAVLLDAALQLSRCGSKGAADAEQWIRRSDGGDEVCSFVSVCEALRLDPTYLARGLLRWQPRGPSAAKLPRVHSGRARVRGITSTEAATPTRCA